MPEAWNVCCGVRLSSRYASPAARVASTTMPGWALTVPL
jgi:hypothetical protein